MSVHGTTRRYWAGCRCAACTSAIAEYERTRPKPALRPDDPRHGTFNGYANCRCRCADCRRANADHVAAAQHVRVKFGLPPGDPRHGTYNAYRNYGCRCADCSMAQNAYYRAYKARKASA